MTDGDEQTIKDGVNRARRKSIRFEFLHAHIEPSNEQHVGEDASNRKSKTLGDLVQRVMKKTRFGCLLSSFFGHGLVRGDFDGHGCSTFWWSKT